MNEQDIALMERLNQHPQLRTRMKEWWQGYVISMLYKSRAWGETLSVDIMGKAFKENYTMDY